MARISMKSERFAVCVANAVEIVGHGYRMYTFRGKSSEDFIV